MKGTARTPRRFTDREQALAAAAGHYPVDYLVALRGDRRHPSQFANDEHALRLGLSDRRFGQHPFDVIFVWLPARAVDQLPPGTRVIDPRLEEQVWGG